MSKRPLSYELIDNLSGDVLYQSHDKIEALEAVRRMTTNDRNLITDASFVIIQNGRNAKALVQYTGEELEEFLEDED